MRLLQADELTMSSWRPDGFRTLTEDDLAQRDDLVRWGRKPSRGSRLL